MQITYTGVHHDLPARVQAKLDAKFAKLAKLLDGKGEHKAHVVVSHQRRAFKAEVTVNYYDHQMVGIGSDADLFKAMSAALEKLDAQAVKVRDKWRETHRRQAKPSLTPPEPEPKPAAKAPRVYRVNPGRRKPITLDEALILIEKNGPYLVYRSAETDTVSVLIRRADGNFDLIET